MHLVIQTSHGHWAELATWVTVLLLVGAVSGLVQLVRWAIRTLLPEGDLLLRLTDWVGDKFGRHEKPPADPKF